MSDGEHVDSLPSLLPLSHKKRRKSKQRQRTKKKGVAGDTEDDDCDEVAMSTKPISALHLLSRFEKNGLFTK